PDPGARPHPVGDAARRRGDHVEDDLLAQRGPAQRGARCGGPAGRHQLARGLLHRAARRHRRRRVGGDAADHGDPPGRAAADPDRAQRGRRDGRRERVAPVLGRDAAEPAPHRRLDHLAELHLELQLVLAGLRAHGGRTRRPHDAADAVHVPRGLQEPEHRVRGGDGRGARRGRRRAPDALPADPAARGPRREEGLIPVRALVRPAQYVALAAYILFLGFPLLWLVSASVKSSAELNSLVVNLVPQEWHWENYADALARQGLVSSAGNSVVVALASTALVILIALPASYVLARLKGAVRAAGVGWILVSQVFPVILVILPLFLILRTIGLTDSLVGLILVHTTYTLPFALWMLQGYVAGIPVELEEAGSMDGASRLVVLRRIVFPLLAPGVVATAMFSFVSSWNEFFFALVLLQSPENYTLPITLSTFIGGEGKVALGPLAAGSVLAAIPSIVFFSIMQRK